MAGNVECGMPNVEFRKYGFLFERVRRQPEFRIRHSEFRILMIPLRNPHCPLAGQKEAGRR